jgi:hypothetical protein
LLGNFASLDLRRRGGSEFSQDFVWVSMHKLVKASGVRGYSFCLSAISVAEGDHDRYPRPPQGHLPDTPGGIGLGGCSGTLGLERGWGDAREAEATTNGRFRPIEGVSQCPTPLRPRLLGRSIFSPLAPDGECGDETDSPFDGPPGRISLSVRPRPVSCDTICPGRPATCPPVIGRGILRGGAPSKVLIIVVRVMIRTATSQESL